MTASMCRHAQEIIWNCNRIACVVAEYIFSMGVTYQSLFFVSRGKTSPTYQPSTLYAGDLDMLLTNVYTSLQTNAKC